MSVFRCQTQGDGPKREVFAFDWLALASRLPGKSLHVAVALLFEARLADSRVVRLSNIAGAHFGLDRNAKYRGLAWLEDAGLISVERKLGRSPMVCLRGGRVDD